MTGAAGLDGLAGHGPGVGLMEREVRGEMEGYRFAEGGFVGEVAEGQR